MSCLGVANNGTDRPLHWCVGYIMSVAVDNVVLSMNMLNMIVCVCVCARARVCALAHTRVRVRVGDMRYYL